MIRVAAAKTKNPTEFGKNLVGPFVPCNALEPGAVDIH
jgi:hypothetical protein